MAIEGTRIAVYRLRLLGALALLAACVLGAPPASASALDDAKAQGLLGERYDGYLGVVKPDAASAKALAAEINVKRRAHYAKIASDENTQVEAVAAIAGAKLVKNAPSGQYVMPGPGASWKRVP